MIVCFSSFVLDLFLSGPKPYLASLGRARQSRTVEERAIKMTKAGYSSGIAVTQPRRLAASVSN